MKKVKVSFKVAYSQTGDFDNLKKMFLSACDYAEKNDLQFINREKIEKIECNAKVEQFLKLNFMIEKKTVPFLFQNYIKQLKDESAYNLSIKIQFTNKSLKTLKKLYSIFTDKSAYYEVKKDEVSNRLKDFQIEKIKTTVLTIDADFKLPEIIQENNFISAELTTITNVIDTKITNKYQDLLNFIK